MRLKSFLSLSTGVLALLSFAAPSHAIILADHPVRNKTAPTGSIANSGWQWEGFWGSFTGTPIAKNYFITASHVGGSVGQSLTLNGKTYKTTAMYDDPNSDLRIWKTSTAFPSFTSIYTGSDVGKTVVIYGRGVGKGAAVTVNGTTHGWQWGPADGKLNWAQNKIKTIIDGGSGIGQVDAFTFDRSGHGDHVSNEGMIANGDSSGGIFVNNGGKWQLAAINYSADGPFKTSSTGATFNASIFDKGGLYDAGQFTPDGATDVPGMGYATRISSNQAWINSIIKGTSSGSALGSLVPEPTSLGLICAAGTLLLRRKRTGK